MISSAAMAHVHMDYHGCSDVGCVRTDNEDHFLIAELEKGLVVAQTNLDLSGQSGLPGKQRGLMIVVADGMGGHRAGERAALIAIRSIGRYVLCTMPWFYAMDRSGNHSLEKLSESFVMAQEETRREGHAHPEWSGMGTTVTLAFVVWPNLYVAHAGDSRCYLMRNGNLERITRDHTIAQDLVDAGAMTEEDAAASRFSNALNNAVIDSDAISVRPEVHKLMLRAGDSLLLCTDGLTRHVRDEEIARTLGTTESAETASNDLVARAKERGGTDNITAVVARIDVS